jgi:hypothetical protein
MTGAPASLLDDLLLEALDNGDHLALFGLRHPELCQGRCRVTEERPARARAEKIDQELLLALDTIFAAMRSEAAELRIGLKSGQQIIRHRRERVITAEALVEGLGVAAHRVLLKMGATSVRSFDSFARTSRTPTALPGRRRGEPSVRRQHRPPDARSSTFPPSRVCALDP